MSAADLIHRLHQHRVWVNHRLLEAVPGWESGMERVGPTWRSTSAPTPNTRPPQIVNMLRQLGVSPLSDVMMISLARLEAST